MRRIMLPLVIAAVAVLAADVVWESPWQAPWTAVSEPVTATDPPPPRFIAHRGAAAHAPENTVAAVRLAAELGADMIEVDVRASADGVPVLMHDVTLDRTTDGSGRVDRLTANALAALDAGGWFHRAYIGEPVPTLAAAAAAADAPLLIDVKTPGLVDKIAPLLRSGDAVESPDLTDLRTYHDRAIPTWWLINEAGMTPPWWVDALSVHSMHAQSYAGLGPPVYAWTVNDVDVADSLIASGVAGIITSSTWRLRNP